MSNVYEKRIRIRGFQRISWPYSSSSGFPYTKKRTGLSTCPFEEAFLTLASDVAFLHSLALNFNVRYIRLSVLYSLSAQC